MTTATLKEEVITEVAGLLEENTELKSTIRRLRQEAITTAEEVKKWLGIDSITFFEGDSRRQQEGYFEVNFYTDLGVMIVRNLKAKDLLTYKSFQKKVCGLTGRYLPDVEQSAWTLFLSQQLDSSLPVRG